MQWKQNLNILSVLHLDMPHPTSHFQMGSTVPRREMVEAGKEEEGALCTKKTQNGASL